MNEIEKDTSKGQQTPRKNSGRKKIGIIILILLFAIGAIIIFFYLRYKATHVTTDNAFIEGAIHTIASKVSGTVKAIHVRDNQSVKKGDLLIEVDPVDFDVKVKEASSKLDAEKAKKLFELIYK